MERMDEEHMAKEVMNSDVFLLFISLILYHPHKYLLHQKPYHHLYGVYIQ